VIAARHPLLAALSFALAGTLGACVVDGSYDYVRCADESVCAGRSSCTRIQWRSGAGSMCTHSCSTMSECPHDGRCLDLGGGSFSCYAVCARREDCPAGFVCQELSTGGGACLPVDP
jgi:hypothetical protein